MTADPWRSGVPSDEPDGPLPSLRPAPSPPSSLGNVLSRYKWSIAVVTLVAIASAVLLSSRQTEVYESQARILVLPVVGPDTSSLPAPEPNMATEAEVVMSVAVARIVAQDLEISGDPQDLLDDLDIGQPEGTEILDISYRHENADVARARAAGFANAYLRYRRDAVARQFTESADVLAAQIQDLEADLRAIERRLAGLADDDPERGVLEIEAQLLFNNILERELALAEFPEEVTVGQVIQPASPPLAPVNPNHVVNAILGMVLGLGAGVGVALVRERLSPRIHSTEEAEDYLRAPMLGAIPTVPQWRGRKKPFLVTRTHWDSPATEAYRILRTSVLSAAEADGSKSIVVTSPHSREGKTATVANLGVVLARAGKRVVLVSADLRRPRLHEFFRRESDAGLSDVLAGRVPLEQVLQKVTFASSAGDRTSVSLWLLPSGRVPENPAELLTSQTMKQVLSKLEDSADIVLIDVPPILPVSDTLSVASVAGSVLVVISPKSANRSAIVSARQQLDKVGARIMGGVLNGPEHSSIQTYAY